ncbi:energy-coupled thiamine transporter ThiT [Weissella paramesenteroides]|uniref:energy-coupled thiamine transporter ThiT n=1 Tax=Weissella paramesenteroides TaxID=1249 RepID=UPI003F28197B
MNSATFCSKSIQTAISKGKNGRLIFFIFVETLLGSLLRLIVRIISAIIYFSASVTGHHSVLAYVTIYNVSYMVPSFIPATLIIMAMFSTFKRLLVTN